MELLKQMYGIFSPSGGEKTLKRFIKRWVKDNVPDAIIRTDNNDGNIYIVRGEAETYPCVVAHLDQVQTIHSVDFIAVETDDIIFGYSPKNRRREGLGADDKNGLWIALKCLEEFDVIKVAFFVGEEIGCVGSRRSDIKWFQDCRFIIEPDRRGAHDLVTDISGIICSDEFELAIPYQRYGYKPTTGFMTDVDELSSLGVGISCINLSCGYYEPHTDDEFTVKSDLLNCLNIVRDIIIECVDVYPNEYKSYYSSSAYNTHYYGSKYDGYYDKEYYDEFAPEPYIPKAINHLTLNRFVEELVINNIDWYIPEDLYPKVKNDLEWFGATKEEFLKIANDFWEFYAYNGVPDDCRRF